MGLCGLFGVLASSALECFLSVLLVGFFSSGCVAVFWAWFDWKELWLGDFGREGTYGMWLNSMVFCS